MYQTKKKDARELPVTLKRNVTENAGITTYSIGGTIITSLSMINKQNKLAIRKQTVHTIVMTETW